MQIRVPVRTRNSVWTDVDLIASFVRRSPAVKNMTSLSGTALAADRALRWAAQGRRRVINAGIFNHRHAVLITPPQEGCVLSPYLFNILAEMVMRETPMVDYKLEGE